MKRIAELEHEFDLVGRGDHMRTAPPIPCAICIGWAEVEMKRAAAEQKKLREKERRLRTIKRTLAITGDPDEAGPSGEFYAPDVNEVFVSASDRRRLEVELELRRSPCPHGCAPNDTLGTLDITRDCPVHGDLLSW